MTAAEIAARLHGAVTVELVDNDPNGDAAYVVVHGPDWTIYADNPSVYVDGQQVIAS